MSPSAAVDLIQKLPDYGVLGTLLAISLTANVALFFFLFKAWSKIDSIRVEERGFREALLKEVMTVLHSNNTIGAANTQALNGILEFIRTYRPQARGGR